MTVTASLWTGTDRCSSDGGSSSSAMSAASMEATAEGMAGSSAAEIARAVLGPGARAASASSDKTVAVVIGDTGDTAVSGTDYTTVTGFNITIKSGQTSGKATFTTTAGLDNLLEPPETLTVKGSATGTTVTPAKGQVENKDQTSPTLTVSPTEVSEGASATTVTVTATTGGVSLSESVEIDFKVSSGTATSGTDYAAVKDFTEVLKAGATSLSSTFILTPTEDTIIEGDETIKVSIPGAKPALEATLKLTDNDQTDITLSTSLSSWSESGKYELVTVKAETDGDTFPADRTITVSVGDSKDSATSGTDYMAVDDFDITIKAGTTWGTTDFYLTPVHDTVVEGDETISVDGTSAGLTVNGTSITLTDDDSTDITLRISPSSVTESASATSVSVTATTDGDTFPDDRTITVSVGDTNDSATSATDYAAVADLDVTIKAGKTSGNGSFTLTPKQDTLVEGDETITVDGTSTGLTVNATSATIGDDDTTPEVLLSVSPSSVSESAGATSVTVTATFSNTSTYGEAKTVSVTVGDSGDSATSGTDYAAVTGFKVTIATGASSGKATFTLTPTSDKIIEGNETITVAGTSTGLTVNETDVTLTDDDQTEITLTASPSSFSETGAATAVTVTAATDGDTFTADKTISVTVGDSGDSATSGTDYAAVAGFDITITKGTTSGKATFTLTPTSDTLVEGNETISVDGTSTGLTVNGTDLTITDDDSTPLVNLTAGVGVGGQTSISEGASATTVTLTAQFSNTSTFATDTVISVTVGDANDSATSGTDYAAVAGFDITIAAGASSATGTFTLTPTDDTLVEGNETISVDGTSSGLTVNEAGVTITDNDGAPVINLSANPSSISEGASATTVTLTAQFSNTSTYAADKTVSVTVGKSGDTATSGTDYAAVTSFDVTITAGQTSGTVEFTLTPTDDTLIEGNETITVSGTNADMTVNGTSMTLTDDDGTPAINLSASPATVTEAAGATTVTLTAQFSNTSTYAADKTISVTVGKSGDTATSGTDYTAVTAFNITIKAGDTSSTATFTLTPTNDTLVEGNETISVSGTNADLTVNATSMTITDDDTPPTITLSANPSSVSEGASATTVTVTAQFSNTSTYAADKTISVTVGKSGDSATSGTDYAAVTAFNITITKGTTSGTGTFTLTPTDDTLVEGDEALSVSGTATGLTVNNTSVTLTDDDSTEITLTASPASVGEGDSATTVTVTAETDGDTFQTDRTVTVKIGKVSDSATSGTDYAAVTDFDITITKGTTSGTATFTLTPADDNIIEGEESLSVSGTSTGLQVNDTSVAIEDNEKPKIILDIKPFLHTDPDKLPESAGPTRVTVTAGTEGGVFALDRQIHVTVGKDGDTAVFGTDWDTPSVAFHVTITAGETEGETTFTLTPTDDTLVEDDEIITLEGSAAGLEVTSTTITIKDNDIPSMTLAVSPASVVENAGDTTVTVTASTGGVTFKADRTVSVTVGKSGDSAASGTDYKVVAAFNVTITKGQTSGKATFTLTPINDTLVEGDESITLAGTTTGLTVSGTSMTLTDDDGPPAVNLSVNPSSVSEGASATLVTVTATFSNTNTFTADKTVAATVGNSGTATSGTDYKAVSNFDITIASGASSGTATFTLAPIQDTLVESNETIGVDGSTTELTVNRTSMTLTDDEAKPYVIVNNASVQEGDSGTTALTFTARLTNENGQTKSSTETITADYKVYSESNDTATAGTDYTAKSGTLTFAPGETSKKINVSVVGDTDVEGDETLTWQWASWTNSILASYTYTGTIQNDDSADITINDASASEGESMTFTITLNKAIAGGLTVTPSYTDGTATEGTDYTAKHDRTQLQRHNGRNPNLHRCDHTRWRGRKQRNLHSRVDRIEYIAKRHRHRHGHRHHQRRRCATNSGSEWSVRSSDGCV